MTTVRTLIKYLEQLNPDANVQVIHEGRGDGTTWVDLEVPTVPARYACTRTFATDYVVAEQVGTIYLGDKY